MKNIGIGMTWVVLATFLILPNDSFAEATRYVRVHKIQGEVMVKMKGETDWKAAKVGMVLREKDRVKTGKGALVEFHMDEEAETGKFNLEEDSVLELKTMQTDRTTGDKTTLLDLAIGKVVIKAEKLKGTSSFEVKTPTSTTGVRGTVFEVMVTKN